MTVLKQQKSLLHCYTPSEFLLWFRLNIPPWNASLQAKFFCNSRSSCSLLRWRHSEPPSSQREKPRLSGQRRGAGIQSKAVQLTLCRSPGLSSDLGKRKLSPGPSEEICLGHNGGYLVCFVKLTLPSLSFYWTFAVVLEHLQKNI